MRALLILALLLLSAGGAAGQYGGSGGGPASAAVEASAPANPVNGQLWLRKSDLRTFVWSDSLLKWLGSEQVIHVSRSAANASGAYRMGETATSIILPYTGYDVATDSLRIMEVVAKSGDVSTVAACTTFVVSDVDTILKLIWDANEERWIPGGSGWVSAAARVAIGPTKTMSVSTGAGGSILPDFPHLWFFCRREVTP